MWILPCFSNMKIQDCCDQQYLSFKKKGKKVVHKMTSKMDSLLLYRTCAMYYTAHTHSLISLGLLHNFLAGGVCVLHDQPIPKDLQLVQLLHGLSQYHTALEPGVLVMPFDLSVG